MITLKDHRMENTWSIGVKVQNCTGHFAAEDHDIITHSIDVLPRGVTLIKTFNQRQLESETNSLKLIEQKYDGKYLSESSILKSQFYSWWWFVEARLMHLCLSVSPGSSFRCSIQEGPGVGGWGMRGGEGSERCRFQRSESRIIGLSLRRWFHLWWCWWPRQVLHLICL